MKIELINRENSEHIPSEQLIKNAEGTLNKYMEDVNVRKLLDSNAEKSMDILDTIAEMDRDSRKVSISKLKIFSNRIMQGLGIPVGVAGIPIMLAGFADMFSAAGIKEDELRISIATTGMLEAEAGVILMSIAVVCMIGGKGNIDKLRSKIYDLMHKFKQNKSTISGLAK